MKTVVDAMDVFFARQARLLDQGDCVVAVDTNDVEYWGDLDEYVHPKKGVTKNTHVLRYATVSIVDEKHKLTLACLPVSKNDKLEDVVKALLGKAKSMVRVDTVLLDRGFYITSVLKTIAKMGMDYVIPLRKGVGSDRIWEESKETCVFKHRYTMKGPDDQLQTWVYLDEKDVKNKKTKRQPEDGEETGKKRQRNRHKKRKLREYVGVLSNKNVCPETVQNFMDWYFTRNNIEVGYKEKNYYKILTSSIDKPFRYLIYCICIFLMNLVQVVRRVNNTFFRNDEMKKLIELLLEHEKPLTEEHRLTRHLLVIA
jgi:hypothetical protein